MELYQYKAKNINGDIIKGKMKSDNTEYVYNFLMKKDFYPVYIRHYKNIFNIKIKELKKIENKDWLMFLKNFSFSLKSGYDILESIKFVKEHALNSKLKYILENVYKEVKDGTSLYEALNDSNCKEKIIVTMIKAGEATGKINDVLEKLILYYEKQSKIQKKLKSAMVYPLVVGIFCLAVLTYLIKEILPGFILIMSSYENINIPKSTLRLMKLSDYVTKKIIPISIVMFLTYMSIKFLICYKPIKMYIDKIKCKIPIISRYYMKYMETNILTILYLFIDSGISINKTVELLRDFIPNEYLKDKIKIVSEKIECGISLGESLSAIEEYDSLFIESIEFGEKSSSLPETLKASIDFYELEIQDGIDRISSLIEPLLMILLCMIVAYIIISSVIPLFSIYDIPF